MNEGLKEMQGLAYCPHPLVRLCITDAWELEVVEISFHNRDLINSTAIKHEYGNWRCILFVQEVMYLIETQMTFYLLDDRT